MRRSSLARLVFACAFVALVRPAPAVADGPPPPGPLPAPRVCDPRAPKPPPPPPPPPAPARMPKYVPPGAPIPAAPAPAASVPGASVPAAVATARAEPPPSPKPVEPPPPPRRLEFPNDTVVERHPAEGPATIVYFYRTNFVPADQLAAALGLLGIGADEKNSTVFIRKMTPQGVNTLLLEGDPDNVEIAVDAMAYFDVPQPQVFLEAKVVEISYESNFEFGLDYLWSREANGPDTLFRGASGLLDAPSFLQSQLPGAAPFTGSQLLFGFVGTNAMKFGDLDLILQALQVNGKAEVLSKPSMIATQGQEATLQTTESFPAVSFRDSNSTMTPGGNTSSVNFTTAPVNTGVDLKVTPEHIGDTFVRMKVNPTVRGVAGLAANRGGTLSPITTTRDAKTTVTMGDGETLVIGGLYTNSHITEKAKTPVLSEIPVLGNLFTRTRETKSKTELVILITPRIVRKTADLRVITPPAELKRLESEIEGEEEPCKPCGRGRSLPDLLGVPEVMRSPDIK